MKAIRTGMRTILTFVGVACLSVSCAAEGPPDFSGVWTWYIEPGQSPFGFGAPELPFKPDARQKVDEYQALVAETADNPGGWCLGTGMPGSMLSSGGYPMEFIQRPEQITIVYEAHAEIRRIYLGDNRAAEEDLFPDRNGYSVGRWDGETLIVETTHLKEQVDQAYAHSDQARIVEQYHAMTTEDGQRLLVADMTMTDPVFYAEPVSSIKKWAFVPKGRLLPYECNEPAWNDHLDALRNQEQP